MSKKAELTFMDLLQAHERAWGNTSYTGRPDLGKIHQSPVVVFWKSIDPVKEKQPLTISLHGDLTDLEQHFSRIIFRSSAGYPDQVVVRIFEAQKRIVVRGVKIVFEKQE